ncbi:MAG: glycogen synthase GlgA [Nitrospira sp. LK265]|nr:glycogen synthase GlgA [Nitrospira sp. LK265]
MTSTSRDGLNIVMATSEAVPYAKTGGLADMVGALTIELTKLGHHVTLLMPGYGGRASRESCQPAMRFSVPMNGKLLDVTVEEEREPAIGVSPRLRVLFVRYDPYFDRPGLYQQDHRDYPDNLERFVLFCRAVLEIVRRLIETRGEKVDVLHLHDWQTALCAVYLKTLPHEYKGLDQSKVLLTLHNMGYQGTFPGEEFVKTGLPSSVFSPSDLEFYGLVNCLKGGIIFSDAVSTVSPTYAKEIMTAEYGCGLEGVLASRADGVKGITNGIDVAAWNPESDPYLPVQYGVADLSGKQTCKRALQREFGLANCDAPLLAAIGRLTFQKGFDLLIDVIPELLSLDTQIVVLGTGDHHLEQQLSATQAKYPDRIGLHLGFDEQMAHRVEAGADMVIMPSRYEPCGLSQLYSLRYGTVPIVRRTGGLADTVVPFRPSTVKSGQATGFHFIDASADALLSALLLALHVYEERQTWRSLIHAGMKTDLSWSRSAKLYVDLYRCLQRERREN